MLKRLASKINFNAQTHVIIEYNNLTNWPYLYVLYNSVSITLISGNGETLRHCYCCINDVKHHFFYFTLYPAHSRIGRGN